MARVCGAVGGGGARPKPYYLETENSSTDEASIKKSRHLPTREALVEILAD